MRDKDLERTIETLHQTIANLNCNAFLGVCHTVQRGSELSWHLMDDEERLVPIDQLVDELLKGNHADSDYYIIKDLQRLGIQEVVLIRSW